MKDLTAGEYALRKIFSSDYEFTIPDYQRPYAWGSEQALQLLDDLEGALARDTDEPYFLGSIVLVKAGSDPRAEVIDGQQRLTTLSILFAVLRDLTGNPKLAAELSKVVVESGEILAGTQAKPRLTLRKRDAKFFADRVQTEGATAGLVALDEAHLKTDPQKAIRDNTAALTERLTAWADDKRQRLAAMLGTRTFLVVVSTPDLNSAHRIFSVMNARGLDLIPSDIFKSKVIGDVSDPDAAEYADKWEQEEVDLGRSAFANLFGHVRMIFVKERPSKVLLQEFDEQVLSKYLPGLQWTHRLGNLVLLNRAKNSEAQNYDFAKKKANYFTSANGSAVFALTTQVLTQNEWTPAVIEARHANLLAVLHKEWELN